MNDRGVSSDGKSSVIRVEVTEAHAGERLDLFLAVQPAGGTRSQIQRLIKEGRASIGQKVGRASTVIHQGDLVTLVIPPPTPTTTQPEELPLEIVYEDADIVVVNKPAGMVVHPAAGHPEGTLVNALLHHVKDLSGVGGELRQGIVHRLDRGTSGLMVVAKHDGAHAKLARQFKTRKVEKEYVTLVWGGVRQGRLIDLPLGRDPVHRKKISARTRRAREAVTRIMTSEPLDGVCLLRVSIETGRTHQIRVHLSTIGHPVVGDALYGGKKRLPPRHLRAVQRLKLPFLHAAQLVFGHPRDGQRVKFSCKLPDDLTVVLNELRATRSVRGA